MKISYDSKLILELSDIKKNCLKAYIHSSIFDIDMKRRIAYVVKKRLLGKALSILKRFFSSRWSDLGVTELPTDDELLMDIIISASSPSKYSDSVIAVDDVNLFSVSEKHKKIIELGFGRNANELIYKEVCSLLEEKFNQCASKLRKIYEPLMKKDGVAALPINNESFCEVVFLREDYMDRATRDAKSDLPIPEESLIKDAELALSNLIGSL